MRTLDVYSSVGPKHVSKWMISALQEYTTSPAVTRTIWVTLCCWLATAPNKAKTTGSSKTGQKPATQIDICLQVYDGFLHFVSINCFFFSAGVPVGVKAASCESSEMAETPVASPATPCTRFYECDQMGQLSVNAKLLHRIASASVHVFSKVHSLFSEPSAEPFWHCW